MSYFENLESLMKIVSWIVGVMVSLLLVVYVLAFTAFGNGLLQPTIESKIQAATKLDAKLQTFSLSMSHIKIVLALSKDNMIVIEGDYSLFAQSFALDYNVKLEALQALQALTQTPLQGSLHTDGKVVGDMAFLQVNGKSDVAKSATTYHVELTDLNPTSIIAKIENARLEALLFMLKQKAYASAAIDLNVNFKNIHPHHLNGDIKFITLHGKLAPDVLKKDFNITIPRTAFAMNLDAKLHGDDVDYSYLLDSNLAKVTSSGKVRPEPLQVALKYALNVKELALLKPISGADVRGALKLNGEVKGSKEKMNVSGQSDIAASSTTFLATLKNFAPATLQAKIRHLKLQKLLYMVKQPHFTDGLFDLDVNIANANVKKLQGVVTSTIRQGRVDNAYITKAYSFKSMMPRTRFDAKTYTKLQAGIADTKVDFNSNLANFDIQSAKFKLNDASLVSDYSVKVADLNKLYFATERHLKGGITAKGELRKAKDLDFTMHSDIAGGAVDAKLHNDDFHATLASLNTLKILDILIYPKIFDAAIDGVLDYNLVKQSGAFDGKLTQGLFTKNQVLDLTKQYARIDLYKQRFQGDVNAKIRQEHILASLNLKSNTSSIVTKNTKLNSKTQQIDSKIAINANGNPINIGLKGNVSRPKVSIDANKLMKKEATKAVKKQLGKLFDKLF